jgi:hypothetical protein
VTTKSFSSPASTYGSATGGSVSPGLYSTNSSAFTASMKASGSSGSGTSRSSSAAATQSVNGVNGLRPPRIFGGVMGLKVLFGLR